MELLLTFLVRSVSELVPTLASFKTFSFIFCSFNMIHLNVILLSLLFLGWLVGWVLVFTLLGVL